MTRRPIDCRWRRFEVLKSECGHIADRDLGRRCDCLGFSHDLLLTDDSVEARREPLDEHAPRHESWRDPHPERFLPRRLTWRWRWQSRTGIGIELQCSRLDVWDVISSNEEAGLGLAARPCSRYSISPWWERDRVRLAPETAAQIAAGCRVPVRQARSAPG